MRGVGKGGPDLKLVVDSTAGSLKAFEGTMFVCGKQPHPSHTMETILFRQRKCQITERERTCAAQGDEKISSGTVFRASKLPNRQEQRNDAEILKSPMLAQCSSLKCPQPLCNIS